MVCYYKNMLLNQSALSDSGGKAGDQSEGPWLNPRPLQSTYHSVVWQDTEPQIALWGALHVML